MARTNRRFRMMVEFELVNGCVGDLREKAADDNGISNRRLPVGEVARRMLTAQLVSNAEFDHLPIIITSSIIEGV